ncbi:hypothetical protein AJ87_02640 [Rhizobium yanglingense]|nr:hypothetical protein AJ87_02640 [Rhizobium yanglingense]
MPGASKNGARKPVFAVAGRGDARLIRRACQKPPVHFRIQPVSGRKMRALNAEVEIGDVCKIDLRQKRVPAGHIDRRHVGADRVKNCRLHQFEGNGHGRVEDLPFKFQIVADVVVFRVDRNLLFAARDENDGARDNQRPERLQFLVRQRIDLVIGLDRRQDVEGIAIGLMQQRGAGNGKVATSQPRMTSPKSMTPSGIGRPCASIRQTTLSPVTS